MGCTPLHCNEYKSTIGTNNIWPSSIRGTPQIVHCTGGLTIQKLTHGKGLKLNQIGIGTFQFFPFNLVIKSRNIIVNELTLFYSVTF